MTLTVLGLGFPDLRRISLRFRGTDYTPSASLGHRVEFTLPSVAIRHTSPRDTTFSATVLLDPAWWRPTIEQPLSLTVLPQRLATFTLTPNVRVTRVVASRIIPSANIRLQGYDEERTETFKVTEAGWRIDPSSVTLSKQAGESSGNPVVAGAVTGEGFKVSMWCGDSRRGFPPRRYPGWGTFTAKWTEVRDSVVNEVGRPVQGALMSDTRSTAITFSDVAPSFLTGVIRDYSGREFPLVPGRETYGWIRLSYSATTRQAVLEVDR